MLIRTSLREFLGRQNNRIRYDDDNIKSLTLLLRPALDMRPIRSRNGHQQGSWEALRRTTESMGAIRFFTDFAKQKNG